MEERRWRLLFLDEDDQVVATTITATWDALELLAEYLTQSRCSRLIASDSPRSGYGYEWGPGGLSQLLYSRVLEED